MSLFRRNKSFERVSRFDDLTPHQPWAAERWFDKLLARHPRYPPWLLPILKGIARRLALNPPSSAWGRSMLAKKGGYASQAKYRDQPWRIYYSIACRKLKQKLGRFLTPAELAAIFAPMFRKYEIKKG